jgi:hypothetical protein
VVEVLSSARQDVHMKIYDNYLDELRTWLAHGAGKITVTQMLGPGLGFQRIGVRLVTIR